MSFTAASALLTCPGQRPRQAVSPLRAYLASLNQSEKAPPFRVHAQPAKLLSAKCDAAGARSELAAA